MDQAPTPTQMVLHGVHRERTDRRSSRTHGYNTCGHLHEDNDGSSTPETCGLDSSICKLKIQQEQLRRKTIFPPDVVRFELVFLRWN